MRRDYGYYRDLLRGRPMPLAFVDLDAFDANCAALVQRSGGRPIRIATKSVRSTGLLRRILGHSPVFQGLMTYSPRETAYLAGCGFDDFLIAYPSVNETDIATLAAAAGGKTIRFMVDSIEHVERIDRIARGLGTTFRLCLDLDMSSQFPGLYFGVRRSPVRTAEEAVRIARRALGMKCVTLDALMGYEAQIAGLPDDLAGMGPRNRLIRHLKRRSIREIAKRRGAVVEALRAEGVALAVLNGGGTGSIESTIAEPCVTEVTVGSGFFSPVQFDSYRGFRHVPSAGFAIEVTRQPAPGVYTCQGGGYIASGPVGPSKAPQVFLPRGAALLPMEGAGEVQTPVRYTGSDGLALGDPVLFRYAKAGEMCERFSTLVLIAGGSVVDEVTTYRGDGYCFG